MTPVLPAPVGKFIRKALSVSSFLSMYSAKLSIAPNWQVLSLSFAEFKYSLIFTTFIQVKITHPLFLLPAGAGL
ncbi:hypothetical protein D9M70_528590 [compost metagenome]